MTVHIGRGLAQLEYQEKNGFFYLPEKELSTIGGFQKYLRESHLQHSIPAGFFQPLVVKKGVVVAGIVFFGQFFRYEGGAFEQ